LYAGKKEDKLNEFDIDARAQNLKNCVDYVFEYFNNYLNITEAEEQTVLLNENWRSIVISFGIMSLKLGNGLSVYIVSMVSKCIDILETFSKMMSFSFYIILTVNSEILHMIVIQGLSKGFLFLRIRQKCFFYQRLSQGRKPAGV